MRELRVRDQYAAAAPEIAGLSPGVSRMKTNYKQASLSLASISGDHLQARQELAGACGREMRRGQRRV